MADNEQRSGVTYYFKLENEAAAKRFDAWVAQNSENLKKQGASFERASDQAQKSMKKTADAVDDAAKKTEKSGRKFIQSISGIYAAFVLAPKIAQEFGEALKEGATGKDVRDSFENLADSVGVNAERLLASMKDAARGTVTEIELMRQANRAFIAGGAEFALAIPQLFEIARAAAVSTGQDVTFVLDSLTKGIAKASIKLIDNAEVYIKVGEAVEEYAEKLGTTADELDVVSRRQAILQAVLEQGQGLVGDVGAEAENAADAFRKYETAVLDAKQATSEFFIDLIGPGAAGQIKALTDVTVSLSGIIQTLALLKIASGGGLIAGIFGTGKLAGSVTKLAGVLPSVIVGLASFALGAKASDLVIQSLADEIEDVTGVKLPSFAKQLSFLKIRFLEGELAAQKYYREINQLGEFSEETQAAQAAAGQELDRTLDRLTAGRQAYIEYIAVIRELNSVLADGEQAIQAMSQAVFDASQMMRGAVGGMAEVLKEQADAAKELEERFKKAAEVKPDIERALKAISNLMERRNDLVRDYNRDLEDEMRKHNRKLEELFIDAAFDRADAIRDHGKEIAESETGYQREVEDAHRQHRFRVEDIERRFQRRMLEIRERFALTVSKAARRRDVLAIINAREQRQIEEQSARRDRDDSLYEEARSYQEALRQAQEAFQERKQELKDSLAEELREIDENLKRRREKEARDHAARLADMAIRHAQRMKDLEEDLDDEFDLIKRKRNEVQRWLNANPIGYRIKSNSGKPPAIAMQHGFSGVVEGPQTFKVEPGVREFVYASGNLKGAREAPAPSAASTSAMALSHSIRGGINVGMSGLSSQMLSGLGPQLQDSIGQALVDAMTAGILASLN